MAKMTVNEVLSPEPVEEECILDYSAEAIAELQASIEKLEQTEELLNQKLAQARAAGLTTQTERLRTLLQKTVLYKNRKTKELREAEARRLADELDAFTAGVEEELDPSPLDEAYVAEGKSYEAKSKRLRLTAKLLSFISLFAGFAGALIYTIITQPEVLNIPFEWLVLGIDVVAVAVLLVIAACIRGSAKKYAQMAADIEEDCRIALELFEQQKLIDDLCVESLEAVAEAYELEAAGPQEDAAPSALANVLSAVSLPKINVKVPEKVKKNAKKIVPVAAVCTGILAAVCLSSAKKRKREEAAARSRAADARKDFFNWLS